MRSYGYGSYHGRSKFRTFLKIVIAALVIVLALLVAAFFYLQQYIVYSADGVRLELPFLLDREAAPTPAVSVTTPMPTPVIVTPEPEPEPEPEITYYRAVAMPGSLLAGDALRALYGGSAGVADYSGLEPYIGALASYTDGYPVPVLTMKGSDGKLQYVSDLQLAKDIKTSASDPGLNDSIRAATGGNGGFLYPAAYVDCFLDDAAPYSRNKLALRTGAGNWRYPGGIRYLSPAVAEARQYLAGICGELSGLGFSELILNHAAFPAEGKLDSIVKGERYDSGVFVSTVTDFYAQVRAAVDAVNPPAGAVGLTKLSVVVDKTVLTGGVNSVSGQSLAALAQYADRLYVRLDPGETPAAYWDKLSAAGFSHPEEQLVAIVDAPLGGAVDYSWAVLPG